MPRPQLDDTSLDFSKMGAETSSAQHELMTGEQSPTMPEGLDDDDHAGRARGSSTALSHHPTDGFLGCPSSISVRVGNQGLTRRRLPGFGTRCKLEIAGKEEHTPPAPCS